MKILITGGSGFIGGVLAKLIPHQHPGLTVLTPMRGELDITTASSVNAYVIAHKPDVIIHAAAFTDNDAAEQERGDRSGACWQTNVIGTKNIVDTAQKFGAFVIYISTGSVFSGDTNNPGPFTETDPPSAEGKLSWYAWAKRVAETHVTDGAIIRLSHPIYKTGDHYLSRLLALHDTGRLYPLFTDQYFPLSLMDDVAVAIARIIDNKRIGIFHVVSSDVASPHELVRYVKRKIWKDVINIRTTTYNMFIKTVANPRRYAKFSAIRGSWTHELLKLPVRSWESMIEYSYGRK